MVDRDVCNVEATGSSPVRSNFMEQKIYFKNSGGIRLCGILSDASKNNKRSIIILCHGFASSKDGHTPSTLQKILNRKNISTFRFDFFGHGESGGAFEEITISEAVGDLLNAINLVKKHGYSKIGLVGSSFGGIASMVAASKSSDVSLLVLKSPVSDYRKLQVLRMGKEGIEKWKAKGFVEVYGRKLNYSFFEDIKNNDGYEAAKKISIPTLIVHGDADDVVPVEQSIKTSKLIKNCKLAIIKGADHNFGDEKNFERALRIISGFVFRNFN